ncbi:MAG TPA: hypothetical protein VK157_15915 [Phycisphaerales bacterium]|nr:hypothetical protein [Phycisphaerales bacterium]
MTAAAHIADMAVYTWPFSEADLRDLTHEAFGDASAENVQCMREQLERLVVIELQMTGAVVEFNVGMLSQDMPTARTAVSQVPYCESYWSDDGETCFGEAVPDGVQSCRLCFFLHEFDVSKPVYDATGRGFPLPRPTALPERLKSVLRYEVP